MNNTATVYLAKALHYANQSAACFDLVITEASATGTAKDFLKHQAMKIRTVQRDIINRVKTAEMRNVLKTELADEYRIDAFISRLIQLNAAGWDEAERALDVILQGEEFKQK